MMGRLKPGVTREQALGELQTTFADTVRESWAARPPDTPNPTRSELPQLRVRPGAQGPDGPRIDARQILSTVFAVVATILLIGCVNLATLLLVRASARRQEVTVRLTIGASRWRVIRQLAIYVSNMSNDPQIAMNQCRHPAGSAIETRKS